MHPYATTSVYISYTQFSYYLGKPVNSEDPNGVVTAGFYNDPLDRPTQVIRGAQPASPLISQTTFGYNDAARTITISTDQLTTGDNRLVSQVVYDGLGRTIETHKSAPEGSIISKESYDAMGRLARSFNPYRSTSEDTYGWTDTSYDGLGRAVRVETFDRFGASTGAARTTYLGNVVTVTDQAGKARSSRTDALGRLTTVAEDPAGLNFTTSYGFDALDDLVRVTQGSQSRFFMYDSLKRLIRAKNVEQDANAELNLFDVVTGNSQWSMGYTYDENSNLKTKTDSRSPAVTITYFYDVLNRVTRRTYTDTTPEVNYFYDNQSLPAGFPSTFTRGSSVGRLVATLYGGATSSAGSYQGYDTFGRVTQSYQKTDSQSYGFSYGYDLAGEMTSETYPSGRVITTGYDSAGRITGLSGQQSAVTTTYGSQMSYTAAGAMSAMALGNGKWEHTLYNSRLQPKEIGLGVAGGDSSLLKLEYGYGTTTNNSNVQSQRITMPKTAGGSLILTQSYSYDALNRLGSVSEDGVPSLSEQFGFDRYGNMWVSASSGVTLSAQTPRGQSSFDQNTNRFNAAVMTNVVYDGGGNLTKDVAGNQFTYDGENRQLTSNAGGVIARYSYDGDGRRVKKVVGNVTTVMVYNASRQLIAEYTSDPVPPASGGGGTSYLTTDALGSTRVVTNATGAVKARYDFLPFGEDLPSSTGGRSAVSGYGGADSTRQKFTGYERDGESGLDYAQARYCSSAQGRFTSVDPAMKSAVLEIPQSWNRYVYVINNPLILIDPNGKVWVQDKKGIISWRNGDDLPYGYTRVANGTRINNVQGATGQYEQYNGHNIIFNADGTIGNRGLYVPPPPAELPDKSGEVGKVLLQFEVLSIAGGIGAALSGANLLIYSAAELGVDYLTHRADNGDNDPFAAMGAKKDIKQINDLTKEFPELKDTEVREAFHEFMAEQKMGMPRNATFKWKQLVELAKEFLGKVE